MDACIGKTTPPIAVLNHKKRSGLGRYRRALKKENQRVFVELLTPVTKHMMACTQANYLLSLGIFLFTVLLEEGKEVRRLRRLVDGL